MTYRHRLILCLCLAVLPLVAPAARAEEGAAWARLSSNVLNPRFSVIGDMLFQAGPGEENSIAVRETELAVQADVDPYARADFFFALPDGEEFELEEGYVTLTSLPFGLLARGGKFRPNFGRLNLVHSHERPQADSPTVLDRFLGEEGLRSSGAEISKVFTPFGLFTEVTYAFLNDLGEEVEPITATTEITDNNGNTVVVPVAVDQPAGGNRTLSDYGHVGRVRAYADLTDATNVELGLSGAIHEPEMGQKRRLGDVDLTVRWKPLQEGLYKSVTWRTEALVSKRHFVSSADPITGTELTPAYDTRRFGGYSYLELQPARNWRVGVRGDYVEDPDATALDITRGVSPYVTFYTSEFNRYRLQYRYQDLPQGEHDHTAFLQWTVVLGPHGAHPF